MGSAAGPNLVEDGLVLALDAGNTKSYDNPTITYVGGTSDSDNSSSFTLSGLQSGDLVLYFSAEDADSVNTPTGASWTAIPGLVTQPDNNGNPNSAAFYVFATGTSVTASGLVNAVNNHVRVMIAFRNVNSTNPFDVNATENSGGGLPDPPSITPVTDNSMIVAVGLLDDHDIANSISPPTGYTTAVNMDSQGGANDTGLGGATIMTAYKLLATAAAEDPSGFTGTTGDPQKGISIALRRATNSTWTDLTGSNYGTIDGSTYNSGDGGSFVFDGTNDNVKIPYTADSNISDALFNGSNNFTVEFWFNADNLPSDGGSNPDQSQVLLGGGTRRLLILFGDSLDDKEVGVRTNMGSWISPVGSGADSINNNTWYNVIITYDSSSGFVLYLNGEQKSTSSTTGTVTTETFDSSNKLIGCLEDDTVSSTRIDRFFDGKISICRIYNKVLTASEVLQNYNANKGRYA